MALKKDLKTLLKNEVDKPIIGQEAVCPDGLGRVTHYTYNAYRIETIRVETYFNNRECEWDAGNVQLVKINLEK